ncbi:MAG: hypothetical protein PVH88_26355 [Ignavibacteria bacterium]|jgi:hypothetical protein
MSNEKKDIAQNIINEVKNMPIKWLMGIPSFFGVVIPLIFKISADIEFIDEKTMFQVFISVYFFSPLAIILLGMIRITIPRFIASYLFFIIVILAVLFSRECISNELIDIIITISSTIFMVINFFLIGSNHINDRIINIFPLTIIGILLIFITTTCVERCHSEFDKAFEKIDSVKNAEENYKNSHDYLDIINIKLGEQVLLKDSSHILKDSILEKKRDAFARILGSSSNDDFNINNIDTGTALSRNDSLVYPEKQKVALNIMILKYIYSQKNKDAQEKLSQIYDITRIKGIITFIITLIFVYASVIYRKRIRQDFPRRKFIVLGCTMVFLFIIPLFKPIDKDSINVTEPLNSVTLPNWYLPSFIRQSVFQDTHIKPTLSNKIENQLKQRDEILPQLKSIGNKLDSIKNALYAKDTTNLQDGNNAYNLLESIRSSIKNIDSILKKNTDSLNDKLELINFINDRVK